MLHFFCGSKQFPALSEALMGHYNHSLAVDATIMVLEKTAQSLVSTLLLFSGKNK